MKKILSVVLTVFLLTSCSFPIRTIRFPKIPDETYANPNLTILFKTNKYPNIVLRVPNNNDKATSNTSLNKDNDLFYNAIEKELLTQGYSVRDRGLFNELLSKTQTTDYSKIKELTNTDVILEVININRAVEYTTNKITSKGKKKIREIVGDIKYIRYGASVEFRIIMVKNNEIAGTYKYNYTPCTDGCDIASFSFSNKINRKKIQLKETVSVNMLEEFIRKSTRDLIKSFK
jgi:hypothetical protein